MRRINTKELIGVNIKKERILRGMSQKTLAVILRLKERDIINLENGTYYGIKSEDFFAVTLLVAEAFGIQVIQLADNNTPSYINKLEENMPVRGKKKNT